MTRTAPAAPRGNLPLFPTPRQYSNGTYEAHSSPPLNGPASQTPPGSVRDYQQANNPTGGNYQGDPRYAAKSQSPRFPPDQYAQARPSNTGRAPSGHSQGGSFRPTEYDSHPVHTGRPDSRDAPPTEQMRNVSLGSTHSVSSHGPGMSNQANSRRPVVGIQGHNGRSSPHLPANANFVGQAFGVAPEQPNRAQPYDRVLWNIFCQVDSDGSGQITQTELSHALINGDFTAFHADTVSLMIRLFDEDRSGTISFPEFEKLWKYLLEWKTLFTRFDQDASGTISFPEFSDSLAAFGYRLSTNFVQFLFRYHDKSRTKEMSFDLFVQSCVTLRMFTDVFKKFDTDQDGVITIGFEDFLKVMIRNR